MLSDLRAVRRVLFKERCFSLLAVLVLALGIGGVATQFSVINGLMLRPPAFPNARRLMSVSLVDTTRNQVVGGASTADYLDWCATQRSFEELACYAARLSINVTYQDTGSGCLQRARRHPLAAAAPDARREPGDFGSWGSRRHTVRAVGDGNHAPAGPVAPRAAACVGHV